MLPSSQWQDFRDHLLACLGGPFPDPCPLSPRVLARWQADGYTLEYVAYESEPGDVVPAYVLIPDGVDAGHPAPAILCLHQHNGQWHLGKSEPAGIAGDPMHHTGKWLAQHGYVVLCPDAIAFEQRRGRRQQGGDYERFLFCQYLLEGRSLIWKNILDIRRAVDYLVTCPEVDPDRIGAYGHSMGSTHAFMAAPCEPRLRAIVCNCCLPTYHAILRDEIIHCFSNYVPGILRYGDVGDIVGLIAPRPILFNAGTHDDGSPIDELRRAVARAREAYRTHGADQNLRLYEEDAGHVFTEGMRAQTLDWFAQHLGPGAQMDRGSRP